jgi:hypothetical protein
VKMLPNYVPVPTLWKEEERIVLIGTSLEVRSHDFVFYITRKTLKWFHEGVWESPRAQGVRDVLKISPAFVIFVSFSFLTHNRQL